MILRISRAISDLIQLPWVSFSPSLLTSPPCFPFPPIYIIASPLFDTWVFQLTVLIFFAVYHNSRTLNCQRLLYLLCQQLDQISPEAASLAIANAVYIARTNLKDLIEQLNAAQLLLFIDLPSQVLNGELGKDLQEEFADLILDEQTKAATGGSGSLLERLARTS